MTYNKYDDAEVKKIIPDWNKINVSKEDLINYQSFNFIRNQIMLLFNDIRNNKKVELNLFDSGIKYCFDNNLIYNYIRTDIIKHTIPGESIYIPGDTIIGFSNHGIGFGFTDSKIIETEDKTYESKYYYEEKETLVELKERIRKYCQFIADCFVQELINKQVDKNIVYGIFEKYREIPCFGSSILKKYFPIPITYGEYANIEKEIKSNTETMIKSSIQNLTL